MNSKSAQPPTVTRNQRPGGHIRNAHTTSAYIAVVAASQIVSGIQATAPRMKTNDNSAPKKTAPYTNPAARAAVADSSRRRPQNSGAGATNASTPKLSGGNAAHVKSAASRAAAKGTIESGRLATLAK